MRVKFPSIHSLKVHGPFEGHFILRTHQFTVNSLQVVDETHVGIDGHSRLGDQGHQRYEGSIFPPQVTSTDVEPPLRDPDTRAKRPRMDAELGWSMVQRRPQMRDSRWTGYRFHRICITIGINPMKDIL